VKAAPAELLLSLGLLLWERAAHFCYAAYLKKEYLSAAQK